MSRKSKQQKILWAIDPFEERGETRKHVLASLQEFSHRGAEIKPVYIFGPAEYGLSGVEVGLPWFKQNEPVLKKVLSQYIEEVQKETQTENLLKPQVLTERHTSRKLAVQRLNNHAKQWGADLILVGTHARKGLMRFFLGSFAETLLLYSKVPVLVVGPHAQSSKIERIFFPTDFGKLSSSLFNQVLALAKKHESSITLFHAVPRPVEPVIQSGVYLFSGAFIAWPDFVTESEQKHRKLAERFIELGKKQGVQVTVLFDSKNSRVSESVIEHAKNEKANLIAMGAESGLIASGILGSVTRQVVRTAPCPVWVVRRSQ